MREVVRIRAKWAFGVGLLVACATASYARQMGLPRVVTGGSDRSIRIWDAKGKPGPTLLGHSGNITSIVVSSDGKKIMSASDDRTVRFWNADDGNLDSTLDPMDSAVLSLSVSPDGRTLASSSSSGKVRLWNTLTGKSLQVVNASKEAIRSVAWSADGRFLLCGGADRLIHVLRADGNPVGTVVGNDDAVTALAWSPDGVSFVSGSADGSIKVWRASDLSLVARQKSHSRGVAAVAVSPDGRTVASAGLDGIVKLLTVKGGALVELAQSGPERGVTSLAFAKDGATLVVAADRVIQYRSARDLSVQTKVATDSQITFLTAF